LAKEHACEMEYNLMRIEMVARAGCSSVSKCPVAESQLKYFAKLSSSHGNSFPQPIFRPQAVCRLLKI